MKTISKILIVLIMILGVTILPARVYATDTASGILDAVQAEPTDSEAAGAMSGVVNRLLGFLQIASALLAVVMIAATGFRYIMETPEMKNELKKSMIPIIVGILLVFFAASIAKFFIGIFAVGNSGQSTSGGGSGYTDEGYPHGGAV